MTPSTGSVGSRITLFLSSTTFPLDGDYVIQWSSTSSFDESKTVIVKKGTVSRGGYSISDSFTVPEAVKGKYYVQFLRLGRDDPVTFQFDLIPSMKVSPFSTAPGNKVTLSCRGFPANGTGSIILDGKDIGLPVTVNSVGSFSREIILPNVSAGARIFEVDMPKLYPEKVTAVLQVVPQISIEPKLPTVNDLITVTGHGFVDNSKVSIKYGSEVITNSPVTDSSGNFSYKFNLPDSSQDAYSIVATDVDGNSAMSTITVEGQTSQQPAPPPETPITEPEKSEVVKLWKPHAISPNGGIFGVMDTATVNFYWQQVTNSKDITYTLQIADNTEFDNLRPGMQQTGLKQNTCTLKIDPGRYYWRVKAIDGSGNESEWAYAPSSFQVGIISESSLIIGIFFFLAFIMILVVIVLLVRALTRRAREYYY